MDRRQSSTHETYRQQEDDTMPPFGVVLGKELLEERGDWHLARAFLYPCALADSSVDLQYGQVRKRRRRARESPWPFGAPFVPRSWLVAERPVSGCRRELRAKDLSEISVPDPEQLQTQKVKEGKLARRGTGSRSASW